MGPEEARLRLPAFPGHQGKEAKLTQVPIRAALPCSLGFYRRSWGPNNIQGQELPTLAHEQPPASSKPLLHWKEVPGWFPKNADSRAG